MRTLTRGSMLAAAAVLLFGCGDPAGLAVGSGDENTVVVSEGVSPTYDFAGAARRLVVSDAVDGTVAWDIQALDRDMGFLAPVEHGLPPAGALEVTPPVILQSGVRHRVTVTLLGGGEATREFTP